MESSVAKDTELSLPAPAPISFPWEEIDNGINLQSSAANTNLRNITDNGPAGNIICATNGPHRERRRWIRPQSILDTNTGNVYEEKSRRYVIKDHITNQNCSKDTDSQRKTVSNNPSDQKHQRVTNLEPVSFHNEPCVADKQFALLDQADKSLSEQVHDNIADSPIAARIASPSSASSITSGKRLEWDSGADVGYNFIQDSNLHSANLSTIERIALVRGCSAALFERLDPEGTSGPTKLKPSTHNSSFHYDSPIAKSTPIFRDDKQNQKIMNEDIIVEPIETVLPGGYLYLHSGVEFENEVAPPGNASAEHSRRNSADENVSVPDTVHKKHSNSLINLNSSPEDAQSTMPRSQSYLNLLPKDDNCVLHDGPFHALQQRCNLAAACSISSSSVATIVQKPIFPKTSDKFIQTLPLKLSVGVQVCESAENSLYQNGAEKTSQKTNSTLEGSAEKQHKNENLANLMYNNKSHKCNGAHKKGSSLNSDNCQLYVSQISNNTAARVTKETFKEEGMTICSEKEAQNKNTRSADKDSGSLESAASSTQTVGSSYVGETYYSGARMQTEGRGGSTGNVGSATSFEYVPGHLFENTKNDQNRKLANPTSSDSSTNQILSNQVTSTPNNEMYNQEQSSCLNSLTKDIEDGVELLQKLMSDKSFNGKMKKKLIRQIVNKLVDSDYAEDFTGNEEHQNTLLTSNVPWVPVAPGSQPSKNIDLCSDFFSGESNRNRHKSFPESMNSSGGSQKQKLISSDTHSASSTCTPSGSVSVPGDNEESRAETSEISSNGISKSDKRDWKLPTSRLEKSSEEKRVTAEKSKRSTPPLLKLCKTEHEKQLQWIRFEIDHLTHLKQLLERQDVVTKKLSSLAAHEHKFHKIEHSDNSMVHNSNLSRFKMNWSNSTEGLGINNSDSTSSHATSCCKSIKADYRRSLSSDVSAQASFQDGYVSEVHRGEKITRDVVSNKHEFSTQTPTLDSYVLCHTHGASSNLKESLSRSYNHKSEVGRLNVYVQTSPRTKRNQNTSVHANQNTSIYTKASEKAVESFERAVKCCCDCKKALAEVVKVHKEYSKKKEENNLTYCKCHLAKLKSSSVISSNASSTTQSRALSESYAETSNDSTELHHPQKRNIETETVVNKSIQTSSSLCEVPIVKPKWNTKHKNETEKRNVECQVKEAFCPCCGLPEMQLHSTKRLHKHSGHKECGTDKNNTDYLCENRGKKVQNGKPVCNASVQTAVKEPLAYLLTFEPTCQDNAKLKKRDSLPEIKLLVPVMRCALENEITKKNPALDSFKENQCLSREIQPSQEALNAIEQPEQGEQEKRKKKPTLQEYLRVNRPDYIQHADKRTQCLADLALLRDLRKEKRLELMAMSAEIQNMEDIHGKQMHDEKIIFSEAVLTGKPRISSRIMREQSRRKYHKTREVQSRLAERKKKEDFRTNRLMAELFTKKLQKKVLQGVVNHSNAASVVSSVP